jgi:hypothetical protein
MPMHGPQPGGQGPGARVEQGLPVAGVLGLGLDVGAGGGDIELDAGGDLLALDDGRGLGDVGEAGVDAAHEVGLVDHHGAALHLGDGGHRFDMVWAGDMGGDGGEVEGELDGVRGVVVGLESSGVPAVDLVAGVGALGSAVACAGPGGSGEVVGPREQGVAEDLIEGEDAGEGAPLGGHVGDGEAVVHGEAGDTVADELDGVVEDLVLVEQAAEGDDDILADDAGPEAAGECAAGDGWHLPPGLSCGPEAGGVGADDWGAEGGDGAVHVGVRVGADDHRAGDGVALLDHDLVGDAGAGGVEVDLVLEGELLDLGVLGEVLGGVVLDVVVDGEDGLGGVVDAGLEA